MALHNLPLTVAHDSTMTSRGWVSHGNRPSVVLTRFAAVKSPTAPGVLSSRASLAHHGLWTFHDEWRNFDSISSFDALSSPLWWASSFQFPLRTPGVSFAAAYGSTSGTVVIEVSSMITDCSSFGVFSERRDLSQVLFQIGVELVFRDLVTLSLKYSNLLAGDGHC